MLKQKPQTNAPSSGSLFPNVPQSASQEIGHLLRQSFFAAPPEVLRELSDLLSTAAAANRDGGDPGEVSGRRTSGAAGTVGPGSGASSAVAAAAAASMIDHLIRYRLGGVSDSYNNIQAAAIAAMPGSSNPAACCCTHPSPSTSGGAHRQSIKSVRGYVRCSERRIRSGPPTVVRCIGHLRR